MLVSYALSLLFFFNDTATTEIYTLSLHDALPIALPVSLWESEVLPRRVPGYRPEQLDQLCATGEVVWVGAGLDRVALFFRDDASLFGPPGGAPKSDSEAADAIRGALGREALFWFDLLHETQLE